MLLHLDNSYGGMPAKMPPPKPIITFKDLKVGLKAQAIKNSYQARKGDIVEVTKVDDNNIYFTTKYGERMMSQIEFCLYFSWPNT